MDSHELEALIDVAGAGAVAHTPATVVRPHVHRFRKCRTWWTCQDRECNLTRIYPWRGDPYE